MQNLPCKRIQCEAGWSFVYAKQKNVPEEHRDEFGHGDVWTWTALEADTKLVPSWLVGERYVERQNLTMRMGMRRFTRLTNAFSKKVENLAAAVALHYMHYNYARPHKTLSKPYPTTPAMAAGITDHVWTLEEIVILLDTPSG